MAHHGSGHQAGPDARTRAREAAPHRSAEHRSTGPVTLPRRTLTPPGVREICVPEARSYARAHACEADTWSGASRPDGYRASVRPGEGRSIPCPSLAPGRRRHGLRQLSGGPGGPPSPQGAPERTERAHCAVNAPRGHGAWGARAPAGHPARCPVRTPSLCTGMHDSRSGM